MVAWQRGRQVGRGVVHVRVRFVWGRGRGLVGGPGGRSRPVVQLSRNGRTPDALQTCECV